MKIGILLGAKKLRTRISYHDGKIWLHMPFSSLRFRFYLRYEWFRNLIYDGFDSFQRQLDEICLLPTDVDPAGIHAGSLSCQGLWWRASEEVYTSWRYLDGLPIWPLGSQLWSLKHLEWYLLNVGWSSWMAVIGLDNAWCWQLCHLTTPLGTVYVYPFWLRDIILLGIECRVGACPFICRPPIGVT